MTPKRKRRSKGPREWLPKENCALVEIAVKEIRLSARKHQAFVESELDMILRQARRKP